MKDPQKKERRLTDLKQRYDLEEKIIRGIREASKDRFVPAVSNGIWQEDPHRSVDTSLPVLIMERMGSDQADWSLAHHIRQLRRKGQIRDAERLAVRAGAQYAELLKILHESLKKVCSDRKPGDYYWDSANACLYVLDWNVVKDLSEGSSDKSVEAVKQIQAEIRQFGEHWFEMLVGNSLSTADEFSVDQPAPGSVWSQLSRGMRRLLRRTWRAGSSQDGFGTDEAAVRAWKDCLALSDLAADDLYHRAVAVKDEAGQLGLDKTRELNEIWEEICDIQALLESSQNPNAKNYADVIKGWIESRDRELERQIQTVMQDGEISISHGDYDKVIPSFRGAAENNRLKPEQRLRAVRWCFAAQALSTATHQGSEVSKQLRSLLLPFLKKMEEDSWDLATQNLEQMRKSYGTSTQLPLFEAELKYRRALATFRNVKLSASQRHEAYTQVGNALNDLRKGNDPLGSTYADLLKETQNYADAIAVAHELERLQKHEETRETERRQIQNDLGFVARTLGQNVHDESLRWPDNLGEILDAWDDRLYAPPYLQKLTSLNRIMNREGLTFKALDAVEEAYRTLDNSDSGQTRVRDALGLMVYNLAIQRIAKFGREPRWPYQVADGIRFGERLSRLALLNENQKRKINDHLVKLKEYRDSQERLRKDAGISKPLDVWSLEHLQDDKIDQSLNEALTKGVELFDPIPDNPEPEKISVARLIAARDVAQWDALQESLSSIRSRSQDLADVAKDLSEQIGLVIGNIGPRREQSSQPHEINDTSTAPVLSTADVEGIGAPPEEHGLQNGTSSGDPEDTSKQHATEGGSRGRVKPIWPLAAAIGTIAVLILLSTRVLPFNRAPEQGVVAEDWTVTIAPSDPSALTTGGMQEFVVTVVDGEGTNKVDELLTIETSGDGILSSMQASPGQPIRDYLRLMIRTDENGARVSYQPAMPGDVITVSLESRVEETSYTIPNPTPSPTLSPEPATATPASEPKLTLIITGNVDGKSSAEAQTGQQLNYMIRVENQGDGAAQDVSLQCTPPLGAQLTSQGTLEQSGDSLIKHSIVVEVGKPIDIGVSFTVDKDLSDGTKMSFECTLSYANGTYQASDSNVITYVAPEPIRITLLPNPLDVGVNETVEVKIRVQQGQAGTPIVGQVLSIQIRPSALVADAIDSVSTDANGEASLTLQAGAQAGRGQVDAKLSDSGESDKADLIVRPTVRVPTANIRRSPTQDGEELSGVDRSKPFSIIGKLQDGVWLQIKLPDGTTAWVSKNTQNTTISGDIAGVQIVNPASDSGESTSSLADSDPRLPIVAGARKLDAQSGSSVAFYRINGIADGPITYLPPQGSVEVLPPESSTPPIEYVLVAVRFWVRQEFVSSGVGTWFLQNKSESDWACWIVPVEDPSVQPENCSVFPRTAGGSIFLSSDTAPLEDNGWKQVTIKAWVKQENLVQ